MDDTHYRQRYSRLPTTLLQLSGDFQYEHLPQQWSLVLHTNCIMYASCI